MASRCPEAKEDLQQAPDEATHKCEAAEAEAQTGIRTETPKQPGILESYSGIYSPSTSTPPSGFKVDWGILLCSFELRVMGTSVR